MYRSTIVIYSEFDPAQIELSELAYEANEGSAYCDSMGVEIIAPESLSDSAMSFFHDAEIISDMSDLG